MSNHRLLERTTATASFVASVALAFTSLFISETHDIAAGVCLVIAQFLILTASIFGIDYHLSNYGHTARNTQQQPAEHPAQPGERLAGPSISAN